MIFPFFQRPFMNSSGWIISGLHLTLRPPTPFNMSLPLLLSLRIALFLNLSSPIPLSHYVHILIGPFSSSPRFHPFPVFFFSPLLPLTFSPLASLLSPISVFLPCFPDHKVVMECKINMVVIFWEPPPQALSDIYYCPLPAAWMYDVWYDSSNKDMDERKEEAGGCN